MSNVTVTVHVQTTGPVAVAGAVVRVYDTTGAIFLAEHTTNGSGDAVFVLPGSNPSATNYLARVYLAGDTFAAGTAFGVLDTSPTFLVTITGQVGPSALLATLVVSTDDDSPAPLSGVTCRIYDSTGATFIAQGTTGTSPDPAGTLNIPLPGSPSGTTYIVRLQKNGVVFPDGASQSILQIDPLTGMQTNIFDFTAHVLTLPESTNPYLCKLSGTFVDVSLQPVAGITLEFLPTPIIFPNTNLRYTAHFYGNPTAVGGSVLSKSIKVSTDKTGYLEVELPRGGTYEVHVYGLEDPLEITSFITVPDEAGLSLLDVMWPFVVSVTFGTVPSLGVGDSAEIDVSATMSNGQVIESKDALQDILDFSIVDSTIASVVLLKDAILGVRGIAAGSTTITAARKAGVVAPRIPPVSALSFTPATVSVS